MLNGTVRLVARFLYVAENELLLLRTARCCQFSVNGFASFAASLLLLLLLLGADSKLFVFEPLELGLCLFFVVSYRLRSLVRKILKSLSFLPKRKLAALPIAVLLF